jgi:hypothetical protein
MYVTCGDFHDGSEKGTASVHHVLCQSWQKCYGEPHNYFGYHLVFSDGDFLESFFIYDVKSAVCTAKLDV